MSTATTSAELSRILSVELPRERGPLRREDRKTRSAAIRKLFKEMGLKGISVTTPSYSMATSTDVTVPPAAEHDRSWQSGHDFATCPTCRERTEAIERLGEIILAAFPDMDDRSDSQSDYFDFVVSIH